MENNKKNPDITPFSLKTTRLFNPVILMGFINAIDDLVDRNR